MFYSKNKTFFLLNENSIFSPLRYFYDDNTAPTEIQNHISCKSIRSLTHTIISSLSSIMLAAIKTYQFNKTIKDKQQLINIYQTHILEQAWDIGGQLMT